MEAQNRSNFLFYAIPDGKPLRTFPGIAPEEDEREQVMKPAYL